MAAQIGFEGRVVTINVDSYEQTTAGASSVITDDILYETIGNLFQKYDAIFLEHADTNRLIHRSLVAIQHSNAYGTIDNLIVTHSEDEGGGGEPA